MMSVVKSAGEATVNNIPRMTEEEKKVKSRECDPVLTRLERYASKTSSIHGIVSWRQHCNKLDIPKNNEENNGRK